MAIKPFAIQGADLTLGGVNLQAGSNGVVIPGVTQAATYFVEEVNDRGDQTLSFQTAPILIDYVTYLDYQNNGSSRGRAEYSVDELDDDGYIDGITVDAAGEYTGSEGYNGGNDLFAYTGTDTMPGIFTSFVDTDWTQVPFRPRMRAGNVEVISGGGAGVVEIRAVDFPLGEEGDTRGTIADASQEGILYYCVADWTGPNEPQGYSVEAGANYEKGAGLDMVLTVAKGQLPLLDDMLNNLSLPNSADWQLSQNNATDGYVRDCVAADAGANWTFTWQYVSGQDSTSFSQNDQFELTYTQPQAAIWEVVGTQGLTGDIGFTPSSEGNVKYALDINGDITLRTHKSAPEGPGNLGPAISLGDMGNSNHRSGVVAIGNDDVGYNSKKGGVYIGREAGWNDAEVPQGEFAIAIGAYAARNFAQDNSITLNATGEHLDPTADGLYIKPIREAVDNTAKAVYYNTTTGEITYTDPTGGTAGDDNIWIQDFETTLGAPADVVGMASSVEYLDNGDIIALFVHYTDDGQNEGRYSGVARFSPTGTQLWSMRFAGAQYTDGWGLAVDNVNGFIYVAGKISGSGPYELATLTKLDQADGAIVWSKTYDVGYDNANTVVDVASDGNPVVVGYAGNGTDTQIVTTKIDMDNGSIIWSRALNGQSYDEAYGMAVGPSGEIVTVGYMSSLVSTLTDSVATAVTEPVSNVNWTVSHVNVFTNGVNFDVDITAGVPTITIHSDYQGGWTVGETIGTLLGSTFGGTDGIDDMVVKVATTVTDDKDRILVAKYASDGSIAWQKAVTPDAGFDCSGADADIDGDGNIYVCGNFSIDNGSPWLTGIIIIKFNSSGVKQWSRKVQGDCSDVGTSIVVGPDNCLYLSAVTGVNNPQDYSMVVAKYNLDGTVAWQRMLDNTTTWTFAGGSFFGPGGSGSTLAVRTGYVAVAGGFGDPGGTVPHAVLAQFDSEGTVFSVGNYDFKAATFTGLLNGSASDITVADANKDSFDYSGVIEAGIFEPGYDTDIIVGTLYSNVVSDAELIGGGHQASTGYKYTVYGDSQGYQGGEETGVILKDNPDHPYTVGDLITFRNGEQKSITEVNTGYSDTWVRWSGPVDGGDSNPRFPITVQSSNYAPETKSTARIKPDLTEATAHDQYMKIYAGSSGPVPTDPGTPSVMDSLHIHMAGAQENVELFLGTDANYVSTKEAGLTPAGVRLHSEVDVSVVNTNLRLDRKGSTWVSVYGDGTNTNLYNNGYDLSWSTIAVDDHGDYYVGGEDNSYATAIINKYSRDGQLIWSKYNDGADYNGWQFDGVAYHDGQVATLVQTDTGRDYNYYKLSVLDSSRGDLISTTDIYDPDGNLEAHSMIHHSTLGWTVVGNTEGEVGTTGAITDTNNPNDYDAIRLLASACLIDGRYPANGQGWSITGTNITGSQNFNSSGVGYFQNRPVVAVTGTGVDAYATVYIDYNANTYNMDVVTSVGSGFAIGDTVKILGSQLGGVDGVNDFTFTCQSNGGLNSYDNYAGTPSRQYIWIDMNLAGGYVDTAFKDGTFTLTRRRSNRPWIWTDQWTRFLNPTPISNDQYAGGQAFCVAEDPVTHDLVVGGYIDTFDNSGTFVWKLNDAGATQWAKTINGDGDTVRGIAVSGLDSSIYVSTNYIYVHKLSSSGDLTKTVSNYGMWGVSEPEVKLAIEEDGFEYVYVGGGGGAIWSGDRSGFFLNKLTTDLVTVWGRGMWSTEDDFYKDYDIEHTNFVLGKGQASLVGFGYPYSLDNTNALIYTISTGDQFEPNEVLGWEAVQNGGQVWNTSTGLSMYNIITAGAQAVTATALTETQTDSLSWTNYAFQSKLINLNTAKRGIVGVETIEFNDGGTLDHNPADIPPSVLFDPSNSSWEYTLQLSDRGRFILNQTIPNDSPCQDLFVYVPRNDQVAFPVGTVITLINASSAEAGGEHIYVRPINYADGNGWVRIWAVGGDQNPSQWRFQGIQTATLMKISTNGWLLTANNIINDD